MENLVNSLNGMNVGQILLFGFWATCVIGFFSAIGYMIVIRTHYFIMKNIDRVRSHFIKL